MNPLLRIVKNSAALSLSILLERAVSFFLPWYIARTQGNELWGLYNTALPFVLIATPFAFWGLDLLLPRKVARKVSDLGTLLGSSLFIATTISVLITGLTLLVVLSLDYAAVINRLIFIAVISNVLPRAESTTLESLLGGLERMELIALVRLPLTVLRTAGSVLLLLLGYNLGSLFVLLGIYHLLISGVYLLLLYRIVPGFRLRFDWELIRLLLRQALPFVLIIFTGETFRQMDRIFLSKLWDTDAVGYYATGMLLIQIMYMVAPAIMAAIFPSLSRLYVRSRSSFSRWGSQLFKLLLILAFPVALAVIAFAGWLIPFVFGPEYTPSIQVLQLAALGIVPSFVARLLYRLMLSADRERLAFQTALLKGIVNLILNILLIPRYGIVGAALAATGIEVFGFLQNLFYVTRWVVPLDIRNMLLRPGLILFLSIGLYLPLSGWNPHAAWFVTTVFFGAAILLTRTLHFGELAALARQEP